MIDYWHMEGKKKQINNLEKKIYKIIIISLFHPYVFVLNFIFRYLSIEKRNQHNSTFLRLSLNRSIINAHHQESKVVPQEFICEKERVLMTLKHTSINE